MNIVKLEKQPDGKWIEVEASVVDLLNPLVPLAGAGGLVGRTLIWALIARAIK